MRAVGRGLQELLHPEVRISRERASGDLGRRVVAGARGALRVAHVELRRVVAGRRIVAARQEEGARAVAGHPVLRRRGGEVVGELDLLLDAARGRQLAAGHPAHEQRCAAAEVVDVAGARQMRGVEPLRDDGEHVLHVVGGDRLNPRGAEVDREAMEQGLPPVLVEPGEADVREIVGRAEAVLRRGDPLREVGRVGHDRVAGGEHLRTRRHRALRRPPARGAGRQQLRTRTGQRARGPAEEAEQHAVPVCRGHRPRFHHGVAILVGRAHQLPSPVVDSAWRARHHAGGVPARRRHRQEHAQQGASRHPSAGTQQPHPFLPPKRPSRCDTTRLLMLRFSVMSLDVHEPRSKSEQARLTEQVHVTTCIDASTDLQSNCQLTCASPGSQLAPSAGPRASSCGG